MDRILILDFGSQVAQLIARRIREAGVYCELHPNDVGEQFIRDYDPKGIILSGSHASALDEGTLKADPYVFRHGVPVLGICYGMQTMAAQLCGVNVRHVYALTFAVSAAFAGAAGIVIGIILPFSPADEGNWTLNAFVVVVLGGVGSPAGALIGGLLGLASAVIMVVLSPAVWVKTFGFQAALFPYDNPALFSMAIAFVGIWLFSKIDATARARAEQGAFEAQYVRSETGIGAAGALAH